ncbi:MAG: CoA pyrophosphatase [Cytophagales bacterium]|nr:CoA pyrophosphatase [Cytophagales bacterium]
MYERFKEKLRFELSKQLPGEIAHRMMMPTVRNDHQKIPSRDIPPVKSAVLVLLYPGERQHIKFPLIQRPAYNGAHSAQVSFPGGKAEIGDRDLTFTALREAHEEIGIVKNNVEVIGELTELFIWVSNFIVTPVVAFTDSTPVFIKDDEEVEAIIEADLFDIINPDKRKTGTIIVREKYKIQTPYFDIDQRIVWGATAMMLSELSMIIDRARIL